MASADSGDSAGGHVIDIGWQAARKPTPTPKCPGDALRGHRHRAKRSSIIYQPLMFTYGLLTLLA